MKKQIESYSITEKDKSKNKLCNDTYTSLCSRFETHGCLRLDQLYSNEFIASLGRDFGARYRRYYAPEAYEHRDALRVGDQRWMVTLKLQPPYAAVDLYANTVLLPMLTRLLGPEFVLKSAGAVLSLPGAKAQHDHRDLPALFDDHPVDATLPCYAITMMVPLIDCNTQQGTTQMRPGSHKVSTSEALDLPVVTPDIPAGSCLLMDYRIRHGGTPNLSSSARPLLYFVYGRPWFHDYRNFKKQPPLCITRRAFRNVPAPHKRLFVQAKKTWW